VTYSSAQLKWKVESLLFSIGVGVPMKMEWVSKKNVYNKFDWYGHTEGSLGGVEARLQAERFRVRIRVGKTVFSAQSPDGRWETASILCLWVPGFWTGGKAART
jgi:hypothetical protein